MDKNTIFLNDFKSVELCKEMQKKCSIESTNFDRSTATSANQVKQQIDLYDDDDSIDENEIYSIDEYNEQKDDDSNASSRLSISCFNKSFTKHPLTELELNPFIKNKHQTNQIVGLDNLPLTPTETLRYYGLKLTDYEKEEIRHYPEIWFTGQDAVKVQAWENLENNNGYDDQNGSYIKVLHDHIAYRYEILEVVGKGSFCQVIKCFDHKEYKEVALKILRNKRRFHKQAPNEIRILDHLLAKDTDDDHNVIHMLDYFVFRHHVCITFELLSMNIYELIRKNNYQGFSINLIKKFALSILKCLQLLYDEDIIHCDLKPENILLKYKGSSMIKVIDFGYSCYKNETVHTYIQSRFYRSPEIILGLPYDQSIDMWSFACILYELYTGVPLFPGENEPDQLSYIMELLNLPPPDMINKKNRSKYFFDSKGIPLPMCRKDSKGRKKKPGTRSLAQSLQCSDILFIDFLSKCLTWRSEERMTPHQAVNHPWLSKQNQRNDNRESQNIKQFTVTESNTNDILNKFRMQTEKFNLVNRSSIKFSSFIKTKSSNDNKLCA